MARKLRLNSTFKSRRAIFNAEEYAQYINKLVEQYRPGDVVPDTKKWQLQDADPKYKSFLANVKIFMGDVITPDGAKKIITGYDFPSLEDLNQRKTVSDKDAPAFEYGPKKCVAVYGLSTVVNGQIIVDRGTEERLKKLKEHCPEAYEQSIRVGNKMYAFARHLSYSEDTCEIMRVAGYLHDIGKLSIDSELLKKEYLQKPLSVQETEQLQSHVSLDAVDEILDGYSNTFLQAANGHHLSYTNGIGYPDPFVSGDNIPFICRMTAICDAYDAITHGQNKSQNVFAIATKLQKSTSLDPALLNDFVSMLEKEAQVQAVDLGDGYPPEKKEWHSQMADLAADLGVSAGTLVAGVDRDGYKSVKYKDPFTGEMVNVAAYDNNGDCIYRATREYLSEQINTDIRLKYKREQQIKDYFADATGVAKDKIVILKRGEDKKADGRPLDTSYEVVTKIDGIDGAIHLGSVNARGCVTDSVSRGYLDDLIYEATIDSEVDDVGDFEPEVSDPDVNFEESLEVV